MTQPNPEERIRSTCMAAGLFAAAAFAAAESEDALVLEVARATAVALALADGFVMIYGSLALNG